MLIEKLTVGPTEENCYLVGVEPRCAVVIRVPRRADLRRDRAPSLV
ncbi:MAG: hypothetical protein R2862_11295 [Thermoanaerobaculia bacterium]